MTDKPRFSVHQHQQVLPNEMQINKVDAPACVVAATLVPLNIMS
jgi:hypothetical protein